MQLTIVRAPVTRISSSTAPGLSSGPACRTLTPPTPVRLGQGPSSGSGDLVTRTTSGRSVPSRFSSSVARAKPVPTIPEAPSTTIGPSSTAPEALPHNAATVRGCVIRSRSAAISAMSRLASSSTAAPAAAR
ncbi:Uncharacterised protein [Mycobacteroides abscessus subsp. abscessus]|nr:Uncharacterised protein [Mycobacteroides abscessus subsp. abscessus]